MSNAFFDRQILNSSYENPSRYWEFELGHPTKQIIMKRRLTEYITPLPKSKEFRSYIADKINNTGKGSLFVIFVEPNIEILEAEGGQVRVKVNGVDAFHPIPAKSAVTVPTASPAGSSTPTTTKRHGFFYIATHPALSINRSQVELR